MEETQRCVSGRAPPRRVRVGAAGLRAAYPSADLRRDDARVGAPRAARTESGRPCAPSWALAPTRLCNMRYCAWGGGVIPHASSSNRRRVADPRIDASLLRCPVGDRRRRAVLRPFPTGNWVARESWKSRRAAQKDRRGGRSLERSRDRLIDPKDGHAGHASTTPVRRGRRVRALHVCVRLAEAAQVSRALSF